MMKISLISAITALIYAQFTVAAYQPVGTRPQSAYGSQSNAYAAVRQEYINNRTIIDETLRSLTVMDKQQCYNSMVVVEAMDRFINVIQSSLHSAFDTRNTLAIYLNRYGRYAQGTLGLSDELLKFIAKRDQSVMDREKEVFINLIYQLKGMRLAIGTALKDLYVFRDTRYNVFQTRASTLADVSVIEHTTKVLNHFNGISDTNKVFLFPSQDLRDVYIKNYNDTVQAAATGVVSQSARSLSQHQGVATASSSSAAPTDEEIFNEHLARVLGTGNIFGAAQSAPAAATTARSALAAQLPREFTPTSDGARQLYMSFQRTPYQKASVYGVQHPSQNATQAAPPAHGAPVRRVSFLAPNSSGSASASGNIIYGR